MADFDLAIIGGGIHGACVARDAAGRGLKTLLVEQNDLASGTSSASTKLIHGGLRYLEQGAFHLVRQSLTERATMLRIAPHIVRPIRFILPFNDERRPRWMIRIGLFIYDWLGGRGALPKTRFVNFSTDLAAGGPLRRRFTEGFEYSDCTVDDSRLVVLNALDAAERGAQVRVNTRCIRADRTDVWTLVLNTRGRRQVATARTLVNATGPWSPQFSENVLRLKGKPPLRLIKGSHILVKSLFDHGRAYIFQNADKRITFAIPYSHDFTMIGTTDTDFLGDVDMLGPTIEEISYLCDAANAYFRESVSPGDVVHAFAGIRQLYDDGSHQAQDIGRDHKLVLDEGKRQAPLLSVYGGKLTTARRVSQEAVDILAQFFMPKPAWTGVTPLPGGDFPDGRDSYLAQVVRDWPFLAAEHAERLVTAYGTRAARILAGATRAEDLGQRFGADLTAAEVRYLMQYEWARTADDVLWRRSKLGLHVSPADKEALAQFMTGATGAANEGLPTDPH